MEWNVNVLIISVVPPPPCAVGITRVACLIKQLASRLKSIVLPTIIPIAIYYGVMAIKGYDVMRVLISNMSNDHYPLPFCWFLVTLACLYLIFYLVEVITENYFGILLFVLLFAVIILCHILHYPMVWQYATILTFVVGVGYKQIEIKITSKLFWWILPLTIVVIGISCTVIPRGCSELLYGLWTLGFFVAYAFLPILQKRSRIIQFLSGISYELYLCQCIGFAIVPVTWNPWVILLTIIIIDITFAVISKYLSKQIIKL